MIRYPVVGDRLSSRIFHLHIRHHEIDSRGPVSYNAVDDFDMAMSAGKRELE